MESEIRKVRLKDLQPTDTVKEETISYLAMLTTEELNALKPMPQVWLFEETMVLSDGNNRSAVLAQRGEQEMLVEYKGHPGEYAFLLAKDIENAKRLIDNGITSPYQLLRK
jgi:hypothetical protein